MAMSPRANIVVFTQANMNAIDGSSVWVQSVVLALAGVNNVDVTLLLSHAVTNDRMIEPLLHHPGVTVIDPPENGAASAPLTLGAAAKLLSGLAVTGPQAFVVRGADAAHHLATKRALKGRLWPYLTDVPQRVGDIDGKTRRQIETIMSASPLLLCQTEELRTYLEANFPAVAGKGVLLPPSIPGDIEPNILSPPTRNDLRLCYAGKFARVWNTYEMCDLPTQLADRGIDARLTMVGDKLNKDATWPGFVVEMKEKLETSSGVEWVGGVSRKHSIELMSSAHIGLSWRSHELDDSLELSTKLLEYCAAGTPPILNRTAMHERIFGTDYPLFVDSDHAVLDLLELVTEESGVYERALQRTSGLAADYTLERVSERLAAMVVDQLHQEPQVNPKTRLKRRMRGDH